MTNSSEQGPYTPDLAGNGTVPLAAEPAPKRPLRRLSRIVADGRCLAKLLGVGLRTVRTWDARGTLPKPIRIGGRVVWVLGGEWGIHAWLAAGAPPRQTWAAMQAARK